MPLGARMLGFATAGLWLLLQAESALAACAERDCPNQIDRYRLRQKAFNGYDYIW